MRRVEMTVVFQVDLEDDDVDEQDLCIEFEEEFSQMVVCLANNTQEVVKAEVKSYETTCVDVPGGTWGTTLYD